MQGHNMIQKQYMVPTQAGVREEEEQIHDLAGLDPDETP